MSERQYAMPHDLPVAVTPLAGTELAMFEQDGQLVQTPYSDLAGAVSAHAASHQHLGSDEIATEDVIANAIPKLDSSGRIDTRVSDASTTKKGKVQLATDGEEDATKPPASTDSRLKDARYPTEHAASHVGGADPIPQATASNDGLMTSTHVQTLADLSAVSFENLPTAGEKAALAGSYGTPSDTNRYITETDPLIASIEGIPVGVPIPVCDDAPALESPFEPMDGQLISDAGSVFNGRRLRNMNGASVLLDLTFTADAGGAYAEIDESDTPAIGLHDWIIGTGIADDTWISDIGLAEPVATSQANIPYTSLELHGTDVYAGSTGDVYKRDGSGVFQATSQTVTGLRYLKSFDGDLYATKGTTAEDVYKMDGSGVFQATVQSPARYHNLFVHNNELCAVVQSVGIYKMDGAGVFQPWLSISDIVFAESYHGLIIYRLLSGPLYAHDGTDSWRYTKEAARLGLLQVVDDRLLNFGRGGVYEVTAGRIVQLISSTEAKSALLVDDTIYLALLDGTTNDIYTIDYSKRLITISDPSAAGAISCTITNEGRGIIGGAFGSVGDQMQKMTGAIGAVTSNTLGLVREGELVSDGVFVEGESLGKGKIFSSSEHTYYVSELAFDSSLSPYARTSDDTWGKTKTDAYRMKYYMRIK